MVINRNYDNKYFSIVTIRWQGNLGENWDN